MFVRCRIYTANNLLVEGLINTDHIAWARDVRSIAGVPLGSQAVYLNMTGDRPNVTIDASIEDLYRVLVNSSKEGAASLLAEDN